MMNEDATKLIQRQLWLDKELPGLMQPLQDEEQDLHSVVAEGGQAQAVQLYLPECEPS